MNTNQLIERYGIPTDTTLVGSCTWALEHELDTMEYKVRIVELTGIEAPTSELESKYVYLYIIQEYLRAEANSDVVNMAQIHTIAVDKANKFMENHPWVGKAIDEPSVPEVDSDGKRKWKRGEKKILVCQLWEERKHENLTRAEWIKILIDEVDMKQGGASTYYASLKNGTFGC
ncbi:MAG: hypothetical protein KAH32_01055 [Chlamydiia bacterium]|nr:hypothetical protein [Chlamydiia bacterium]